ncbi:MAG TPA: hypothetical protein VNJ53_01385 [Gaiellaceae bacterium]|nr:hypothetical protein [Gaiellaceae bacterium]
MRSSLRALLVAVVAAGATAAAAAPGSHWTTLRRPLEVPRLAPGAPCPASGIDASVDFARFGVGPGLGPGPVYPVGLADGTLELAPARNFGSRHWLGQKVLWFVHPRYRGPVLVRGRQLDGPARVRFERGDVPPLELRILPTQTVAWAGQPDGARGAPSYTRLRAPGCYGYQVDVATFSYVVVFRGVRG